ncbi:MAG TPA: hypothetical protein DCR81_04700 [Smithella sp.]|nr:hypothetical protein [Smithella sp.]
MNLKRVIRVFIIFSCILTATYVYAADILSQIHPYISVKGEYSDNLNLTHENQKKDFYTTISPGVKFSNMDAQSGIDLDASAGAVFYNDYTDLNYISANANLNAKYLTSSHFNFYLKNSYIRSDNPMEREFFTTTQDNKFVLATETQRGIYWRNVVSPTVEYQFGPESRVGVNYRNNVYQTAAIGSENSMENYVSPFITYWLNRQNGISLSYAYANGHFETSTDFNSHKVNASYMLRFTPKATASLNGGYTKQEYSDNSMNYAIYESSLGISYLFSSTLSASAQAGYYWQNQEIGQNNNGVTFKADITQKDARTTYNLSVQGGYTQDLFTAQNLGFRKYYRATGSITHFLDRQLSIGCLGSVERSESESDTGQRDTRLGAGANISYLPFQWLKFSLEYAYNQNNTNYFYEATNEYKENRGMLTITATY